MYPSISVVCSNSIFTTNEHPEEQQLTFPAGQTLWTHFTLIKLIMHKPGPPRFALSTILGIFNISIFKKLILKIIRIRKKLKAETPDLTICCCFLQMCAVTQPLQHPNSLRSDSFLPPLAAHGIRPTVILVRPSSGRLMACVQTENRKHGECL